MEPSASISEIRIEGPRLLVLDDLFERDRLGRADRGAHQQGQRQQTSSYGSHGTLLSGRDVKGQCMGRANGRSRDGRP